MKAAHHNCPNYCHYCPDIRKAVLSVQLSVTKAEAIMPGCMGVAAGGDMSHCTCHRPTKREFAPEDRLARLEEQVAEILKLLKGKDS